MVTLISTLAAAPRYLPTTDSDIKAENTTTALSLSRVPFVVVEPGQDIAACIDKMMAGVKSNERVRLKEILFHNMRKVDFNVVKVANSHQLSGDWSKVTAELTLDHWSAIKAFTPLVVPDGKCYR